MITQLIRYAEAVIVGHSTPLKETDIFLDRSCVSGRITDWDDLDKRLKNNLTHITHIWFHTQITGWHKNPIVIRGISTEGKTVDYVLCCPPYEVYAMLSDSAFVTSNTRVVETVESVILSRFPSPPPKIEPKSECLIIRRFEGV